MSESYHVQGIKPPDEKFEAMRGIWNSCVAMSIDPPDEVQDFFSGEPPPSDGDEVDLRDHGCVSKYSDDMKTGFTVDVDLDMLPDDIKTLRFYVYY